MSAFRESRPPRCLGLLLSGLCWLALLAAPLSLAADRTLRIAAPTTMTDTGLLDALIADFRSLHPGFDISVRPSGAIAALERGRRGEADLVISHFRQGEELMVQEGYGTHRAQIFHDTYVFFGPPDDPAGLARAAGLTEALQRLARARVEFLEPSPRSGTYKRLHELWAMAEIKPTWNGYRGSEQSAQDTLAQAAQTGAYAFGTLSTYLANRSLLSSDLVPLFRDHPALNNVYSAIVVNGERISLINQTEAEQFLDYLVSDRGQQLILRFGESRFGSRLFIPVAHLDDALRASRLSDIADQQAQITRWLVIGIVTLALVSLVALVAVMRFRRTQAGLRQSEQRAIQAMAGTTEAFWEWDLATDKTYYSSAWKELLGYHQHKDELPDTIQSWREHLHPEDRDLVLSRLEEYLESPDSPFSSEHRLQLRNGSYIWVFERGKALWDRQGTPTRLSVTTTNISHRRLQIRDMEHQSLHDLLTDLPNRSLFMDRFEQQLMQLPAEGQVLACLVISLDEFNALNNRYGREAGNEVLRDTAQRLQASLDKAETTARIGGDEFGVLLHAIDRHHLAVPIQRLVATLAAPHKIGRESVTIRASIGVAIAPDHGHDVNTLMQHANVAMYKSKRSLQEYCTYTPVDPGTAAS